MSFKRFLICSIFFLGLSEISLAVQKSVSSVPWLRLNNAAKNLQINKKGNYLAFTDQDGNHLSYVDLSNQAVYFVSRHQVGSGFFWSPDSVRLFFREHSKTKNNNVQSKLKAYDTVLHKTITLDTFPYITGVLTFDPKELKMQLMYENGIHSKRIYFPDERLARWQVAIRQQEGKWIVSQNGVVWLYRGGLAFRKMTDDQSGVDSFAISPDGVSIAWSTKKENLYVSDAGENPISLGKGKQPYWHPTKKMIVFSAPRMLGKTNVDYDLKISEIKGSAKFITSSQFSEEQSPVWYPDGKMIIYTKNKTTDLYRIEFTEQL